MLVWVRKFGIFHHVGIYLGNGEICSLSADNQGVVKTDWRVFLGMNPLEIFRYSSRIPFKNYKEIVKQIVWAKDNSFGKGGYNVKNKNCEHFANMAVLGINYSKQIYEKGHRLQNVEAVARGGAIGAGIAANGLSIGLAPFTGGLSLLFLPATIASTAVIVDDTVNNDDFNYKNNGKGSTIKLTDEVKESNNRLGKKSDFETRELEARIEQVMPSYIPANSCRIM